MSDHVPNPVLAALLVPFYLLAVVAVMLLSPLVVPLWWFYQDLRNPEWWK